MASTTLANKTVGDLVADKRWLIFVNKSDSVETTLAAMNQYNVSSVPVFDPEASKFVALVSSMDLMGYVAFDTFFKRHKKEQIRFDIVLADMKKPILEALAHRGLADWERTLQPNINVLSPKAPLTQALDLFARGIHRVLVVEGELHPEKTKVLSQADLILNLLDKFDSFPQSYKRSLAELGLVAPGLTNKIVALSSKNSALEGFRKMYRQNVPAVAIVDDQDKLVGTLSASDIRGLTVESLKDVFYPALEYLSKKYQTARPLVTCTGDDTLKTCMERLILGKVHRVWIADKDNKLVGVVTMTDVLRTISHLRID